MKKAMTKDEVALLVDLIQNTPILTSKETNATTNKCKDDAWFSVARAFNARSGSVPKTKDQLKLKWDNLKKAARKRSQQVRMNNLKTGGGKSDFIPHDDVLEKVTGLLGSTCTGFDVLFGCDGIAGGSVVLDVDGIAEVSVADMDITVEHGPLNDTTNAIPYNPSIPDDSIAETPCKDTHQKKRKLDLCEGSPSAQSSKFFFGMPMSRQLTTKNKGKKTADRDVQTSIITRNLATASYYDKKKEKLDLEIRLLQLELAQVDTDVFDDDKNEVEDDSDTIVESNVCRVCLALDVKMYDLKDIALREMFQTITGISVTENNHSILDCLCWECAGRLKTAADFRNKALLSDTLLQGLANTSEQVRKNDITLLKDNKGYLKLASNLSTVETFHTVNIDAVDLNVPTIAENNDIETLRNIEQKDSTGPNESIVKRHTDVMGSKHELIVESLIKTEIEYDPVNINGDDKLMTEAQIKTETDFDSIDPNTGENRIIVSETNSFVSNTSNIEDTNNSAVTSPLPGCSNSELQCLLKTPDDCGDEIKKTPTKSKIVILFQK